MHKLIPSFCDLDIENRPFSPLSGLFRTEHSIKSAACLGPTPNPNFDYLDTGIPGPQPFDIVDPNNPPVSFYVPLDKGFTSLVPVPPAVWLFASGLLGLIAISKRQAR